MAPTFRTNLNLLPVNYRRWALFRAALTVWAGVWLVGIAGGCLTAWHVRSGWARVHEEVAKFERMYAPTQVMQREMEAMRRQLVLVQAEKRAAAGLENDRPALALLGIVSRASLACDRRLHVRECTLKRDPATRATTPGDRYVFGVKGASLDLLCVTQFHGVLRNAAMFDRVELRPTTSEQIGETPGYAFHVECFYE